MIFEKKPKINHLRVFGCFFFASMFPRCDKFQERARMAVMIGYCENKKGYRLYEYKTGILFVSRNVIFKETILPFKEGLYYDTEDLFNAIPRGTSNKIVPENNVDS